MNEFVALGGIVAALTAGVVSPGPSFVMVARTAAALSRASGLAAALGMGLGGLMFCTLALLGLQAVLLAVPSLYVVLKVLGGLYLCYLGWRIFRGAREPLAMAHAAGGVRQNPRRAFWLGLATQVSNPKTAIVYASVFAAFLPHGFSAAFAITLAGIVFAIETGWYAIVALALSSPAARNAYLGYKAWIDRVAGAVMVVLGLRLVVSSYHG
jgi:threonine/homoserine/homoserine lactone efflux protein